MDKLSMPASCVFLNGHLFDSVVARLQGKFHSLYAIRRQGQSSQLTTCLNRLCPGLLGLVYPRHQLDV